MTTPQNELYMLSRRVWDLYNLLNPEEDEADIFERVKQIELQQLDIMTSQERIENQMALIIKLLGNK